MCLRTKPETKQENKGKRERKRRGESLGMLYEVPPEKRNEEGGRRLNSGKREI